MISDSDFFMFCRLNHDVGWNCMTLYLLARGFRVKKALEIGIGNGKSTLSLLKAMAEEESGELYSIDKYKDSCKRAMELVRHYGYYERWKPFWVDTKDFETKEKFDLIFIDGDHAYESVKHDFEKFEKHLSPNGIICLHDSVPMGDGNYGISKFIKKIPQEKYEIFTLPFHNGLTMVKPK